MRNLIAAVAAVLVIAGCGSGAGRNAGVNLESYAREFNGKIEKVFADSTKTEAQQEKEYAAILLEEYGKHKSDSIGLMLFTIMISDGCIPAQEAQALYDEASEIIRNDVKVKTKIEAVKNIESVSPGRKFKEITGTDALTGEALSLSSFMGGQKPVLVDFWASWCSPCRQEIKEHLLDLAASGKVRIAGVAVWEKSMEDTRMAMSKLGISWPVIYTGGREASPTIDYGVLGIPTLFLIAPDGTILASGHSIDEFADKLPK